MEKQLLPFSHVIHKFRYFQTVLKHFLKHYGAQFSFFLNRLTIWALKCTRGDGLKISKFTRTCMENESTVTVGGNRYFWHIRLKVSWLPNFNMLFSVPANKIFQKRTVFMFTGSYSTRPNIAKGLTKPRMRPRPPFLSQRLDEWTVHLLHDVKQMEGRRENPVTILHYPIRF